MGGERSQGSSHTIYILATRTPTLRYLLVGCDGGRRISLRPSRGMGCVCVYVCDSFLFLVVLFLFCLQRPEESQWNGLVSS